MAQAYELPLTPLCSGYTNFSAWQRTLPSRCVSLTLIPRACEASDRIKLLIYYALIFRHRCVI